MKPIQRGFGALVVLGLWALLMTGPIQSGFAADDEIMLPAPQPTVSAMIPAGVTRGTSIEVKVQGNNLAPVNAVRVEGRGITAEILPPPEGKNPNPREVTVKLTAATDAAPGLHEIRVVTPGGTSNVVRFGTSALPELTETEPNETAAIAMRLGQLPVVVNGAVNRGEDRDCFRFSAKAGQQIVLDLCGQRLHPYVSSQRPGWFEGILTVREASEVGAAADAMLLAEETAAEKAVGSKAAAAAVASSQAAAQKANAEKAAEELAAANTLVAAKKAALDRIADKTYRNLAYSSHFGGREDPMLTFTVPKDGQYVVEVRDDLYRGRAEFNYRLTIGELPYVTSAFPSGGQRGTTTPVSLDGVNLVGADKLSVAIAADAPIDERRLERASNALGLSNDFSLEAGDDLEVVEAEPNDVADQATATQVPAVLNGVIEREGDIDYFKFTTTKGQRLIFETVSRSLGSPLDARLDLYDLNGRRLKNNDDSNSTPDSLIDHTFAADGDYVICVGDTTSLGSRRHVYRLKVHPPRPYFSLTVSPDNPRVAAGGTVALKVLVQRRDGFSGDIELSVPNPPAGAVISPAVLSSNQTEQTMSVTMPADAAPTVVPFSVVGIAKIGDQEVTRQATPAEQIRYINAWRYVPVDDLLLSVMPKAPLTLTWAKPEIKLTAGETVEVAIKVQGAEGFTAPVRVVLQGLPSQVAAPPVTIEENATEAVVEIRCANGAPANVANVVANGSVSFKGRTFIQGSPALRIQVEVPEKKE